jgi:hypothetical protein
VLLAYLDESYTDDRYYIAAVIIDESDLGLLEAARARMDDFNAGFGIPSGTEMHAHSLMTGRDGFEPVAKMVRARIRIFQQWLSELAALPVRVVVRGVDIPRLNARYKYPDPPHRVVLQHVLEDVNAYARQRGMKVRIVADEVPGQVAHAEDMVRYQVAGTPGYKSSTLESVVPPLAFEDSARMPGLQAADGVAYLYRRLDAHTETDARVAKSVRTLWGTLEPLIYKVWRWNP